MRVLAFAVFLFAAQIVSAQTPDSSAPLRDSVTAVKDTSTFFSDSLFAKKDTTKSSGGIDSVVTYSSSDSIVFTFSDKQMKLYGKGKVQYRDLALTAEQIEVNWNSNNLEASGVLDSSKAMTTDSLKQRYRGTPVMKEGSEEYKGWKIGYNFKTQKGRVTLGETESEKSYYYGEQIKKVDRNMMFISNGMFTTCELGHPHFYFFTPEMRMTMKDKIVARPIYLYISDVPIFALPFGVFPSQGGRRSGIIAPAYGDDGRRGRYLSHLGYYEAINDYMDFSIAGDWYTSGAYRVYPNFRYAKRYDFTGSISGEYARDISGEPKDFDRVNNEYYRANLIHHQTFNPTTRLDVDFTFASNNSFQATNSYKEYLQQEIYSNATLSKSWEGTNRSMTVNISRRQDLRLGNVDATLPAASFSQGQVYPFRFGKTKSSSSYQWYEMIGLSYSAQGMRKENKTRQNDTTAFTFYKREGINHSPSINLTLPKLGYFSVTPSLNYSEKWYDKSSAITGFDSLRNPVVEDKNGFEAVRYFSTGVNVSTKLYGILNSPIPGIVGFRHTVTPSISYFYQPDFSEKEWGYYTYYTDRSGRTVKFNRFQKEIFGGAPAGKSQAINMSVGNLFEMKTAAKDTIQKEQKYQLLNLGASAGYNFAADSMRLSDLSVNFRTDVAQILGLSGNANYSFYEFNQTANTRVNKFLFNEGKGIARMTSFSVSASITLSGERRTAETQQQKDDSIRVADNQLNRQTGYRGIYQEDVPDFSVPWNLSVNFNFNQNQENPKNKFRNASVNGNLGFSLTENWRFTMSGNYDLIRKQFAAPSINIFRDLHCWEMSFQWTPIGALAGYRFEIKVKAPQLQDIKVTKTENNRF
ncbi:MAG: LPS-assembly protein LptD [Bacteroidetes bacterium]|nr:LPS-assembly protein LptD [Bacteroidota bacterium]